MSSYDPRNYEERQAANDRSRKTAFRSGNPWLAFEDVIILEEWVKVPAADRDESGIADRLSRTIEACRNRAHLLAGIRMGMQYATKTEDRSPVRYDWMKEWEEETGGRCEF